MVIVTRSAFAVSIVIFYQILITGMQTSEDGQWMWNGEKWVPNTTSSPLASTLQSAIGQDQSVYGRLPASSVRQSAMPRIVPLIGTILLLVSFFLPYLNIIGFTLSAFDLVFLSFEIIDFGDVTDGGSGEGSFDFSGLMFFISLIMFSLSPIFYFVTMIVSTVLLATKKRTMSMGIFHLGYFAILAMAAVLGSVEIFGNSMSIFSFIGSGFYLASLAPILWLFQNPPKALP